MYSDKKNILQLVALLKAHGVRKIVLCPGSRNAAIVHTLANIEDFTCYSVTDERSAGFFAIGLSLQGGGPAAVCCTSGSALLNLHPAVAEAFYQQVPLIVISADRPAAWIGQMDGQTLPQPHVFGTLVKMSVNLPEVHTEEDEWFCNRLINEAILETTHHGKGPVHINVPISEPIYRFTALNPSAKLCVITTTMLTFGMGASTQALFARVGGGIYTKAADVGADLVGKVEAGIPEDDPRNPATIADNVGDNVGDVAGMGADLYESYCGSILATAALGAAAFIGSDDTVMQFKAVIAPMLIAAVGIVLSIIGIFAVRTKENAGMKELLGSLATGTNLSSVLIVVATFLILWALGLENWVNISFAVVVGLIVGIVIGRSTEYYTSQSYKPTQRLAESGKTGPATVIISGIGLGMVSTTIPVLAVVTGIILSYWLASGFDFANISMGLYGIGIAAVGMLSTLGITLATDAYGPIADNAGGNAEMSGLGKEVRKRTDALDSLGNTTAATGKGFAIGSAALTGLALLASYVEEIRIGLTRLGQTILELPNGITVDVHNASFTDYMLYYDVTLMNPKVLSGMFLGSMMAFLFCGLTMNAVGRAAAHMVEEVRRQFREIKGILTGEAEPDYARCVQISTKGAQREMVFPSLLAIIAPIATGLIFGVPGVIGLLIGGLSSGFVLAIFMANAGGAWDNAKKFIEEGNFGGKGSEVHKATVTGDTVGDPFKDTSGPSLNILIKLMSMVAIVMAGLTVAWSLF